MTGGPAPSGAKSAAKALFADTYRPVRLPWTYRPAVAVVLLLALLQPLIYFATLVGVGLGVWWWAMHGGGLVGLGETRVMGRGTLFFTIVQGIGYLGPLLGGVLVELVLIGSLIPSRQGRTRRGYAVAPIEQPLLYAYVYRLCDIMGAPRPVRIELTPEPNASASFDGGVMWLVRPRLVLTIGTTLVWGMSRRQLTGVIAHELGHFTQGVGMRSSRVVHAINAWFVRVVEKRGAVDDFIETMIDTEWWPVSLAGAVSALLVAAVRGFVLLIASGSRLATMAMLRRMEYAADRCQARVAGSGGLVSGAARLIELGMGYRKTVEITGLESVQRRLPKDLAALAVAVTPRLERDGRGFLKGYEEPDSVWSTHPPMTQRVIAAIRLEEPGIVLSDGPATKLFRDFAKLSGDVTMHLHEQVLDGNSAGFRFLSVDELLGRGEAAPERQAVERAPMHRKPGERVIEAGGDDAEVIPFAD